MVRESDTEGRLVSDSEERLLWPAGAPGAEGQALTDVPAISIHLPNASMATGTGIVVNPGGGYRILASDHEGLQVARWLNRRGRRPSRPTQPLLAPRPGARSHGSSIRGI